MELKKGYFINTFVPILFYGILTGIFTGVVIWTYIFFCDKIIEFSGEAFEFVRSNFVFLPVLIIVLSVLGLLSYFNVKLTPEARGGGVPYTEGVVRGLLPVKRWWQLGLSAMVGSLLSFLGGLPLGSEGPSVLIGTSIGEGVNNIGTARNYKRNSWRRFSATAGASAGFAVAFNAPLAGIIFSLEECHKRFSPMILLTSAVSVLTAVITSKFLQRLTDIGVEYIFTFSVIDMTIANVGFLILAGLGCGIFAALITYILELGLKANEKINIPLWIKFICTFVIVGVVGVFVCDVLYGGSQLITKIGDGVFLWYEIVGLLLLKVALIGLCTSVGTTGGMFIPFLCIGGLIGGLLGNIFVAIGMDPQLFATVVVISMCAFMGAMLKAPITALVLITELTGQFASCLWASGIAIILAYLVVELLDVRSFYDVMMHNLIKRNVKGKERQLVNFDIEVKEGSFAEGRSLRDILLPANCMVVFVYKKEDDGKTYPRMDKDGERKMRAGYILSVQAETYNPEQLEKDLHSIVD